MLWSSRRTGGKWKIKGEDTQYEQFIEDNLKGYPDDEYFMHIFPKIWPSFIAVVEKGNMISIKDCR